MSGFEVTESRFEIFPWPIYFEFEKINNLISKNTSATVHEAQVE